MPKEKSCKYDTLMKTIETIQQDVANLRQSILKIKEAYDVEEICPDVVESDKAVVEALETMCLNMLLEEEAKGDA